MKVLVQIGGTRDGLDPYLGAAKRVGWSTALVESPAYHAWRRIQARPRADVDIEVEAMTAARIAEELRRRGITPTRIVSGFEIYTPAAFGLSLHLGCPGGATFAAGSKPPFGKDEQRRRVGSHVRQPRWISMRSDDELPAEARKLRFPVVVKPPDSGGALGVFLCQDLDALHRALEVSRGLTNFDGSRFTRTITEEFVPGVELSVQGVVRRGRVYELTLCQKIVDVLPSAEEGISTFREVAHIALPGSGVGRDVHEFVSTCAARFEFADGPFHTDFVRDDLGYLWFLEMGFRLSGGFVVDLVRRTVDVDWAEAVLGHGDTELPLRDRGRLVVGQVCARRPDQLEIAGRLSSLDTDVEILPLRELDPDALRRLAPSHEAELASDIARHTGLIARVILRGESVSSVGRAAATVHRGRVDSGAARPA